MPLGNREVSTALARQNSFIVTRAFGSVAPRWLVLAFFVRTPKKEGLVNRMPIRRTLLRLTTAFALLAVALPVWADLVLTLPNDFIERFKNRATITTDFEISFAHDKPKKPSPSKPSNDGDIHISGVPAELKMPAVAELMNAASQPKALAHANAKKGTGQPVRIIGVWRFWPEHGGDDEFFPGMAIEIPHTNPDHIFEIHPTTEIGGIETRTSFFPIPGYRPREATDAFHRYENIRARIFPGTTSTKIRMGSVGFNYVQFRIQLREDPTHELEDGLTVFADVKEIDGETLQRKRRMVFVKDTRPEKAVRTLKKGECMLVLGMPRLNLSLVAFRASHGATDPDVLQWNLPYEMVIVGDYKDNRCEP